MIEFTLILGAAVACGCIWYALHDAHRTAEAHSFLLAVAGLILVIAGVLTFFLASVGGLGGVLSFLILIATSLITIVGSLLLFLMVRPSHRWLFLLFAAIYPLLLWGLMVVGDSLSPENRVISQATDLIRALDDYQIATGNYPETLAVLLADYLQALPEVTGPFDWFYRSNGDTYSLGYIPTVDRWTYSVYLYTPETATWEMDVHPLDQGPFVVPPTPFPLQ